MATKCLNLNEIKYYLGVDLDASSAKCNVTPEQAAMLLKKCNKGNRRLKPNHVETLKRDMESGNWYNDIDYIGFDKTGKLVNGQHRLKALSMANVNSIQLKFDFDVEQHISMDTGATRKYTDQVSISKKMGVEILPNTYRMVVSAGVKLSNPNMNLTNTELVKIGENYMDSLVKADNAGLFNLGNKIPGMTVKSSLLWAYMSGVDLAILSHFAEVLRTGVSKSDTDIPIIRLRDELMELKGNGKSLDVKRAELTQQCIYNVLAGSTSNRLPAHPIMHYQDYPFLDGIK